MPPLRGTRGRQGQSGGSASWFGLVAFTKKNERPEGQARPIRQRPAQSSVQTRPVHRASPPRREVYLDVQASFSRIKTGCGGQEANSCVFFRGKTDLPSYMSRKAGWYHLFHPLLLSSWALLLMALFRTAVLPQFHFWF